MIPIPYENRQYWCGQHAKGAGRLATVGYTAFGEGFNRVCYDLRRAGALRLLARHPEIARFRLLEAAVGVGAYAPLWQRLGVGRWVGLDIAEDAVAHCRTDYPNGEFHTLDLTRDRWPAETSPAGGFDLVTAIDVLYHLVDDRMFEAAIGNLAPRVRPGGALLVSDVLVRQDRQIAPHVKRRSLETYRRALGPGFVLAGREPVFSILADPVPQSGLHICDQGLLAAWRVIARLVLYSPEAVRDAAGAAVATLARPVDAILRKAGLSRGVNLELALFRRKDAARPLVSGA